MYKNRLAKIVSVTMIAASCALAGNFGTSHALAPSATASNVAGSAATALNGGYTEVWRGYKGWAYVGVRKGVNVRRTPSLHGKRIGGLGYGKRVRVYYTRGGWAYIGHHRWVAAYLLVPCK
jgi:hypothetical protein